MCAAGGNSERECLQTGLWRKPGGLPAGECRLCSEAPQSRGRTEQGPYSWPALPRSSWPPGEWYCPTKLQAAGSGSRHARVPPQAHPRWCLSPGPRPRLRPPSKGGCWQGLSPHYQQLELRGPRQREGTSKGLDAQPLLGPAASGQQGEQEGLCDPRSALAPSHRGDQPSSCLTDSGSPELPAGAGGRNRPVHVVLPWPGSVDPRPGPQAQGQGTGENTTPKRFSPGLGSIVRGWREERARVLANRPLEAAGEVFQRERAGFAQRSHRPGAGPSMAPAPGQPCPDLPGLRGGGSTAPPRVRLRGLDSDMPGRPPSLILAGAFPLGLGLD